MTPGPVTEGRNRDSRATAKFAGVQSSLCEAVSIEPVQTPIGPTETSESSGEPTFAASANFGDHALSESEVRQLVVYT